MHNIIYVDNDDAQLRNDWSEGETRDEDTELAFLDEAEYNDADQYLIESATNQTSHHASTYYLVCKDDSTCFLKHQNSCCVTLSCYSLNSNLIYVSQKLG